MLLLLDTLKSSGPPTLARAAATSTLKGDIRCLVGDRIGETLTGETAPVVVNVFGDDLDGLAADLEDAEHFGLL